MSQLDRSSPARPGYKVFEDPDDPGVQIASPLLEQAAVGHLLGKRVLERVLQLGEEGSLVEELGRLEASKTLAEGSPRGCLRWPATARMARPYR